MNITLSEEEITAIRRINARIQGHFGGLAKSQKKTRAARKSIKKAIRVRLETAAA